MGIVKRLPKEVAARIAAGEVIERPASAVKELVENSLDAEASSISIELDDGGKTLIRVTDDGVGIDYDDVGLAVENFSTSKIEDFEDITRVTTLGFRGEALASIRAVSDLTIRSKRRDGEIGREMVWKGETLVKDRPYQMNPGTDILVRKLFHDLPARRKFLGSGSSELRRILSLINSYAVAYPVVSFKLVEGGRELLNLVGGELGERIEAILGSKVFDYLEYFNYESSGIKISGYASLPDFTRGNRSMQFYYVNGRPVRNRVIYHAVQQAYYSTIPRDRYPAVILFLEIDELRIDVNIHPTKSEVKFENEGVIHRGVVQAVRSAIGISSVSSDDGENKLYRGVMPPSWKGERERDEHSSSGYSPTIELFSENSTSEGGPQEQFSFVSDSPLSLFEDSSGQEAVSSSLYWQLHDSYILIQIRKGMVIVDQHAAHERVLYDMAVKNMSEGKALIQSLLFPSTIELTPEEFRRYEEFSEILPAIGFDIEPFGLRTILVRGVPAGVKNWDEGRLLKAILDTEETNRTFAVDDFLKNFACKSAIKAGMKLSLEEMQNLVDSLFATDYPFTCPHGRPTMLRVYLADLEKRFHRTVKSVK